MKEYLTDSLPMMLYRTLDAVMPKFRAIFGEYQLTEQQWRVMRLLWDEEACSLLEMAGKTLIPAPSLVGVVDRLSRDGLVERRRSEKDRRVVQVCLTEHGKKLEAEVTPAVEAAYSELTNKLSEETWQELYGALQQVIDAANADRPVKKK